MKQICSDLEGQYTDFDNLVVGLNKKQWHRNMPFFGWSIFDEVAHIAFFDHEALVVIEDPAHFRARSKELMKIIRSDQSWPAHTNPLLGAEKPEELLPKWREIRSRLLHRLGAMRPEDRLPWYGPDMSALSFATARLMETWAHSQDVYDTLQIKRLNDERLRHVAHIGVSTFGWSFIARGLEIPEIRPRVELTGPFGGLWRWGPADASEWLRGSAEDFCLVVTQRRNVADTGLQWHGNQVGKWLTIAQAFAGVPQNHPEKGARVVKWQSANGQ